MKTKASPTTNQMSLSLLSRVLLLIPLVLACFALSQSAQAASLTSAQNVNVVNTTASPAPTLNTDEHARRSFQNTFFESLSDGTFGTQDVRYAVVANKGKSR